MTPINAALEPLILTALVVTVGYIAACAVWPFGACRPCRGTGKLRSPSGRAFRYCRRCRGTGARVRSGRRAWTHLEETKGRKLVNSTRQHPQLAAAQEAAARGWPVFPLVPGTKRPAIRDWETRATTDPDRIRRCWTTGSYGVGIATGPAGLVVLDLDTPKDGQTPPDDYADATCGADTLLLLATEAGQPPPFDTHTVHTPTSGIHLYYTAPHGTGCTTPPGGSGGSSTRAPRVATSPPPAR